MGRFIGGGGDNEHSTSDRFTPPYDSSWSHSPHSPWWWFPYSTPVSSESSTSASDGLLSSHYFSASDGSLHSHGSIISEGSTSTHSSPGTVTVPEMEQFFNKDMVRRLKFIAGATIITSAIAGVASWAIVRHNLQDS